MSENQTQFNHEEPLFQDVYTPHVEEQVVKKKFLKTKKGLALLALVSLTLIVMLIATLAMPKKKKQTQVAPTPTVEIIKEDQSFFEKRVSSLEAELNRADPTDTVLPFPAVDMNIALEPVDD